MESYEGYFIFAGMIGTGVLLIISCLAVSVFIDRSPREKIAKELGAIGGFAVHLLTGFLTVLALAFLKWLLKS